MKKIIILNLIFSSSLLFASRISKPRTPEAVRIKLPLKHGARMIDSQKLSEISTEFLGRDNAHVLEAVHGLSFGKNFVKKIVTQKVSGVSTPHDALNRNIILLFNSFHHAKNKEGLESITNIFELYMKDPTAFKDSAKFNSFITELAQAINGRTISEKELIELVEYTIAKVEGLSKADILRMCRR